ncbi:SMP-30/gluconolactonase/LRE family protein [Pontibacter silvestris]|uniref:SMP-30/gluconolactonase/LRE family protein n=1 Tax=Pontibacter silvestris TaxID=2305183 RepID=A0ABW4WZS0_9BACT|nr:SMP-30/gluconolactonase/LRE family protein [Pontibacter silvestris]MCC9135226.1 SMP-30/gluconolactonase/LRE family protein [Pontibacter silvestris]
MTVNNAKPTKMNMRVTFYTFLSACLMAGFSSCSGGLFRSKPPVELNEVWASDNTLRTPESVLLDQQRNVLYVSNINKDTRTSKDGDGFISRLAPNGEIEELYWVSGLNDPHGMALHNNVLYVADIDEIVAISTQTGAVLGRYQAEKAQMLNDVVVDNAGNVFVTDTEQQRIYIMRNGRVTIWLDKMKEKRPNGLFLEGDRMIVAFSGSSTVKLLDTETKNFTNWTDEIPSADGIARAGNGGYFVSNWNGEVYFVNEVGRKWRVLDTKGRNINAADISFSEDRGTLYVPTFNNNRIVAYDTVY